MRRIPRPTLDARSADEADFLSPHRDHGPEAHRVDGLATRRASSRVSLPPNDPSPEE